LINHIDEGLYILKRIGASEWAQRAYAIHPILQGDDELAAFWSSDQVPPHPRLYEWRAAVGSC
jgi:hypothetical protein